jgi:Cof subfamily protein (haloacid dehalogenase superfamily)
MDYQHLCLDLDGTTLALKSDITDFCARVLTEVNKTTKVVLVSARIPSGMEYIQEKIHAKNQAMICYNGAYIIENNSVIQDSSLPLESVLKVYEICKKHQIDLGIYSYNNWWVPSDSERVQKEINNTKTLPVIEPTERSLNRLKEQHKGVHKLMLMGTKQTADSAEKELGTIGDLTVYRSNDTLIEIAPLGINKYRAIETLLGSDLSKVMAFGDNYNDIEMIQNVGIGVVVDNARASLKEVADFKAGSCKDDGVAHFLNDYFKLGF